MSAGYGLDPNELIDVVNRLTRFSSRIEQAVESAERQVNRLHTEWSGAAADAHRQAHQQWRRGAEELREGLDQMRAIAEGAHANYGSAASANTAIWRL